MEKALKAMAAVLLLASGGDLAAQPGVGRFPLSLSITRPTAMVAPTSHCQPRGPTLPSGPVCPNSSTRSFSAAAAAERGAKPIAVSDLMKNLQVRSPANLALQYVRPVGTPQLTDFIIGVFEGDSLAARFTCDCEKRLSAVKEGDAVVFSLKEAYKQYGAKLLNYSIVAGAVFAPGTPLPQVGEMVVMRSVSTKRSGQ